MRSLIERVRFSATALVAIVGTLLAVIAFFTFDKIDRREHRHAVADVGASAEPGEAPAPAALLLRARSERTKVDQIAIADARII